MLNTIKTIAATCGAALGYFLGGFDGFLIALVILMVIDCATGIMVAYQEKTVNSKTWFIGVGRKVVMLLLVGLANILDVNVLGTEGIIRTATIFFYLANEGLSILENAGKLGIPLPSALVAALEQLKDKSEDKE